MEENSRNFERTQQNDYLNSDDPHFSKSQTQFWSGKRRTMRRELANSMPKFLVSLSPSLALVLTLIVVVALEAVRFSEALKCYDCVGEDASCNTGECQGATCVMMETASMDTERRQVRKGCIGGYEDSHCKQSSFGSKLTTRCTCDKDLCNGDQSLVAAGLQAPSMNEAHRRQPLQSLHIILAILLASIATLFCLPKTIFQRTHFS